MLCTVRRPPPSAVPTPRTHKVTGNAAFGLGSVTAIDGATVRDRLNEDGAVWHNTALQRQRRRPRSALGSAGAGSTQLAAVSVARRDRYPAVQRCIAAYGKGYRHTGTLQRFQDRHCCGYTLAGHSTAGKIYGDTAVFDIVGEGEQTQRWPLGASDTHGHVVGTLPAGTNTGAAERRHGLADLHAAAIQDTNHYVALEETATPATDGKRCAHSGAGQWAGNRKKGGWAWLFCACRLLFCLPA